MNDPSLRPDNNILKEIFRKDYLSRARERAKRRRNPWNLILLPIGLACIIVIGYALFQIMWRVHVHYFPDHAHRFDEFWNAGISPRAFRSSFLLMIPLFIAAVPLGLLTSNGIAWCIPPARRVFDAEGQTVGLTFGKAMRDLLLLAAIVVPLCLMLSFYGAVSLESLK